MSRTREIEVWVEPIFANTKLSKGIVTREPSDRTIKAKLIIELPERKVTISESDFDKAFKFIARPDWLMTFEGFELAKEKLFKDA